MTAAYPLKKTLIEEKVDQFRAWCEDLLPDRWSLYGDVISEASRREIPFAVGGGLAAMAYAGHPRDTKDIDLYVEPTHREAMIQMVLDLCLTDHYEHAPYDRNWIFRACHDDSIVDIMWSMANHRATVDSEWLKGPTISVHGLSFRLLRPEETLWSKLYVFQHDRCDWPDAINLLYSIGSELDWTHLLARTAEDAQLLGALLMVFHWICPDRCNLLPPAVLNQFGLTPSQSDIMEWSHRATLLDSRPWFTPTLDENPRPQ
ncbi:MAG: hypothetical protein JWP08_3969 [Bryobacterales bacterium]|nr:hypothetical protein [Bryobacterales bacterium]